MKLLRPLLLIALFSLAALLAASGLESHDPFCASCHTRPESEYFARSIAVPTDLASSHAKASNPTRCIDCHSGPGIEGRLLSFSQGAKDLMAYVLGEYDQPAQSQNPLGDLGCTKCHPHGHGDGSIPLNGSLLSKSHYHREDYLSEWRGRDPDPRGTCSVCHVAHIQSPMHDPMAIVQVVVNAACEDCHSALSGWVPAIR